MDSNYPFDCSFSKLCSKIFCDDPTITPEELPKAEELDKILEFATVQGVLPLIIDLIKDLDIPDTNSRMTVLKWYGIVETNRNSYHIRLKTMEQLATIFKKEGLAVMFLKGATLAQMYPHPDMRMFSDVDFYLYGKCDEGTSALERAGIKSQDWAHHHMHAVINGVLIENHYDFLDRRNHQCNLLLDDELKSLAESEGRRYQFHFDNPEIDNAYCMSPTMNAIFLIRHMSAHFVSETITVRMLFDWALFLKNYSKDVDWEKILFLFEESGMIGFARRIQEIVQNRLELRCSECEIEPLEGALTDRIWQSIFDVKARNPYQEGTFRYLLIETKTFFQNRWKHRIVFPNESYLLLFFKLAGSNIKIINKKRI